jgi:DNA helicase II / ATP-dependent DNA helicase PcrA
MKKITSNNAPVELEAEKQNLSLTIDEIDYAIQRLSGSQIHPPSRVPRSYNYSERLLDSWQNERTTSNLATLQKARPKPYQFRIDIVPEDNDNIETYYIGIAPLDNSKGEILTVDWRSPLGTICTRYNSAGSVEHTEWYWDRRGNRSVQKSYVVRCELIGKRSIQVEDTQLISYTDIVGGSVTSPAESKIIADEILRSLLDRNAIGEMHEIVRSIQAEQDEVIREAPEAKAVIVQGPTGSGKTVIALHRAAYLLYQWRQKWSGNQVQQALASSRRILFLSPTKVFRGYVSNVLIDLYEDPLQHRALEEIFRQDLETRQRQVRQAATELRNRLVGNSTAAPLPVVFLDDEYQGVRFEKVMIAGTTVANERVERGVLMDRATYEGVFKEEIQKGVSKKPDAIAETKAIFEERIFAILAAKPEGVRQIAGAQFKGSLVMENLILRYMTALRSDSESIIADITFKTLTGGHGTTSLLLSRDDLLYAFGQRSDVPLLQRWSDVTALVKEKISDNRKSRYRTPAEQNTVEVLLLRFLEHLQLHIQALMARSPIDLYRMMWKSENLLRQFNAEEKLVLPQEATLEKIAAETVEVLERRVVRYEDIVPLLLLDRHYRGGGKIGDFLHVIVDEAQDCTPLQYRYIQERLPKDCSWTVVGDQHQGMNPACSLADWDILAPLFGKQVRRKELTRSYRSTREILDFASQILKEGKSVECVRDSGIPPKIVEVGVDEKIEENIAVILSGLCEKYRTIAILTTTLGEAEKIFRRLKRLSVGIDGQDKSTIGVISDRSSEFGLGIWCLPIYLAKGLEFDAVIISNANETTFYHDSHRRLLYVGCTRALHELVVLSHGKLSTMLSV